MPARPLLIIVASITWLGCAQVAGLAEHKAGEGGSAGVANGGGGQGGSAGGGLATAADRYGAAVLADGPIAYWRLDETMLSMPAVDEQEDYPGVFENSIVVGVPGLIDGSRAVHVPDNDDLGVHVVVADLSEKFEGLMPFTLEAWISPDTVGDRAHGIIDVGKPDAMMGTNEGGLWWHVSSLGFLRLHRGFDGGVPDQVNTDAILTDGGVYHVAVTYDGSLATHYIDGVVQESGQATVAIPLVTDALLIGSTGAQAGANSRFGGIIDDVAIYDKALTAAQIAAHYDAAAP